MSSSLHLILIAACVVMQTLAQCGRSDHPNCANWKNNGFCNNAGYTLAMKQQYCPFTCPGICGVPATTAPPPATTTAPVIENANCGKWNTDPANAFCANPAITVQLKQNFCKKTCAFEIAPTSDCAIYASAAGVLIRVSTTNRTPFPGTAVGFSNGASVVPLYAYAGSRCTVTLFEGPPVDVIPGTSVEAGSLPGAAGNFQKITNPSATAYTCTCN